MVSFVPPAPSMRTRTRRPGRGPSPAWSRARRMISTWSAAVLRPGVTGPQHDHRALTPTLAGSVVDPGGQGVVAEPLLEGRGRALLVRVDINQGGVDVDHQRVGRRDTSRGGVRSGQGPRPLPHHCAGPVHGGLDRLDVVGQGPHQPTDCGVGGHRPEDLPLASQQGHIRQAPAAQGHAHRQIRHDLARVVHRPRPPPRRQDPRELVAQARDPARLGQQPRPGQPHRRHVPRLRHHRRVQPAILHHEGAPLLVMHGPKQSALSQEKEHLHPTFNTSTMKTRG